MPISGTTTNYTGRTNDISIFQGVNPNGFAQVTPSFGRISQYCAGIQKLVQRYAISLLTSIGSQMNYLNFGTNLVTSLMSSNVVINNADLYPIFNFANMDVITSFRAYQRATPNLPPDEQLGTAKLLSVSVEGNSVSLNIQIFPLTGGPVTFVLPLPEN